MIDKRASEIIEIIKTHLPIKSTQHQKLNEYKNLHKRLVGIKTLRETN